MWVMKTCELCGAPFEPTPKAMRNRNYQGRFCSRVCSNRARKVHPNERFGRLLWGSESDGNGCWVWAGTKNTRGYGVFSGEGGRQLMAHRLAYAYRHGPIPAGQIVLHSCDNPGCVNPDHLRLGTKTENNADRDAKGRQATGERSRQSRLTEDGVRAIRAAHTEGAGQSELARRYGVTQQTVWAIVRRKTWGHVR